MTTVAVAPFAPLHEVAAALERRELSPVELTEAILARIDARDPALFAFQRVLRDQALEEAALAEREIAAGRYRGPLAWATWAAPLLQEPLPIRHGVAAPDRPGLGIAFDPAVRRFRLA